MNKIIFIFFIPIFIFAQTIKIATYNVENLFDGENNGNEYRDFKIGKSPWDYQKYKHKLANIKEVIKSIDADIIALQEIENEDVLKELIKGTDYKFISFKTTKNAPVGLGLISKLRPILTKSFSVAGVKTRDILKVSFEEDEKIFSIFINHFPAFKKNGITSQKKAERTLRVALENEKNAIVLGDFNSPYGKKSILNDIQITKNYINLWEFIEPKQRYSFAAYGKKRAIDHILLSPEFMDTKYDFIYVCDSFKVFKNNLLNNKGFAKTENKEHKYSDHLPLVFEISTDKDKACRSWSNFLDIFKGKK
ncbi:putative endonuclease/exonuclease/phosphatase [Campylobacter pinnipediorum subsp. caledonicus]|uniref:endonuclease/exonuclease/phosphatase family protein n=1 Tax=Campylobacter pinnipediorum TaxID=1965231 RepID=UPI0009951C23|nr:endonuclease/exonuclease/phosphatase family protein [Campylobacter pinnipediorum]AQW85970.1 putative endonuclease/exonuclease/phosphatase [Campylobacter pinnipediorum subsp. caledonicus]